MTLDLSAAEWLWFLITAPCVVITSLLLHHAREKRAAWRLLNGKAEGFVAQAGVEDEYFRLATQVLLFLVGVPSYLSARDVMLITDAGPNWPLLCLLAAPMPILANSLRKLVRRHQLDALLAASHNNRRAGDQ